MLGPPNQECAPQQPTVERLLNRHERWVEKSDGAGGSPRDLITRLTLQCDVVDPTACRFPDRLYQIADVDCMWTPTYHTLGAAESLAASSSNRHYDAWRRSFPTRLSCATTWAIR